MSDAMSARWSKAEEITFISSLLCLISSIVLAIAGAITHNIYYGSVGAVLMVAAGICVNVWIRFRDERRALEQSRRAAEDQAGGNGPVQE
ncbi:hypothetical protein OG594_44550 [Streptomyces sp. NBC_01214]|uniref:hypothetical protein n=1 Tax=Streptomyces sp. NBC_01214 TaxID=2903777 RepID=UPI0022564C15|nr:hypothetical protein [Streptomyces sp. NBC_01214]MCX4808576.1 hypothetical protein [Streptomyces sp. NBC_01214]